MGPKNRKHEVKLRHPLCCPLKHSMTNLPLQAPPLKKSFRIESFASASHKPHPSKPQPCNMPQAKTRSCAATSESRAAETALQHLLFCNADLAFTKSCAATSEKLHCNIEKAALQESGAFLPFLRISIGAHQKGDSKWEKPVSARICGFQSAVSCGFLRESATPNSLDLQSEPKISENQRKSAFRVRFIPFAPFWRTLIQAPTFSLPRLGPADCRQCLLAFASQAFAQNLSQKTFRYLCQGFSNVPWRKRAFGPGAKYVFLDLFLGILGALCTGKGAPLVRYLCTT